MIVIEVRGGSVQEIYSSKITEKIILVDWDNIQEGGQTVEWVPTAAWHMSKETQAEVENVKTTISPVKAEHKAGA